MSFYVVALRPDGTKSDGTINFREDPLPDHGPFETGVEAGKAAKLLSEQLGVKVHPRRMRQAGDWRVNAAKVLVDGTTLPLPEGWDLPPIPDHFAHIPIKRKNCVGYFASEAHGVIGRVTAVKPSRYLQEFHPALPEVEQRRLCALFARYDFELARTPDEIEWVYEHGPGSCMTVLYQQQSGGRNFFRSPFHPVRVYGAGDLAVAYRTTEDGKRATERTLCWPDRQIYSRVYYGDGSRKLEAALSEAGWRQTEDEEDFDGARLLRHVVRKDGERWFVCPYIDSGHVSGGGHRMVRDDGEFLVIDCEGEMEPDRTDGLMWPVFADDASHECTSEDREAA